MAIVKFVTSGCPMNNIFPYVMDEKKTDGGVLVSGIHCMTETALDEFRFVKNQFGKTDGRQYYHIVQSFSPDDDLDAETAHEIGLKFAEFFPGYQIVVATHCDKNHLHNHLVMNSVNMENGKKFHQSADELVLVKEYSNRLCREYGLSETETRSSLGFMPKWKQLLRNKAYSVANRTRSKEEFIWEMNMHGYKVDWKDDHKYITFTTPDGHKCRDNKLFAEQLLKKNLEIYFALGGCESGLAEQYKSYVNDIQAEHTYTVGEGLFNLLKNLLETIPYDERFTPPVDDRQLDKMTVMMLEAMGIKVEPTIVIKDTMKNQSSLRTLPLLPVVRDMLLKLKAEQQERIQKYGTYYNPNYLDYVCVDETGNLIRPDTLTTHFKTFLVRHNLPVIRLHELRHSCASILIACGVSMKAVQEWLGHSTFSTTADIYSHLNYSSKLGIAETLSDVFSGKPVPVDQTNPDTMATIQKIFYASDVEAAPKVAEPVVTEYESWDEDADDEDGAVFVDTSDSDEELKDEPIESVFPELPADSVSEFKKAKEEMKRLGFETLDEYFEYLDYKARMEQRKNTAGSGGTAM